MIMDAEWYMRVNSADVSNHTKARRNSKCMDKYAGSQNRNYLEASGNVYRHSMNVYIYQNGLMYN